MILEVIFNDIFNQIISKIFFSSKIFSFQKRKTSTPSSHHSGMHSLSMSQSALMFFRTKSFPATRSLITLRLLRFLKRALKTFLSLSP